MTSYTRDEVAEIFRAKESGARKEKSNEYKFVIGNKSYPFSIKFLKSYYEIFTRGLKQNDPLRRMLPNPYDITTSLTNGEFDPYGDSVQFRRMFMRHPEVKYDTNAAYKRLRNIRIGVKDIVNPSVKGPSREFQIGRKPKGARKWEPKFYRMNEVNMISKLSNMIKNGKKPELFYKYGDKQYKVPTASIKDLINQAMVSARTNKELLNPGGPLNYANNRNNWGQFKSNEYIDVNEGNNKFYRFTKHELKGMYETALTSSEKFNKLENPYTKKNLLTNTNIKEFLNKNAKIDLRKYGPITKPITKKVGSSRVDLQACKLEYSIVSPK